MQKVQKKVLKLGKSEFEEIVYRGLEEIPEEFKKFLKDVFVVVEEYPDEKVKRELGLGDGTLLFGLYQGVPIGERSSFSPIVPPSKITIFMYPILSVSKNVEDVKNRVIKTVIHEIAHHFGIGDDYLHKIGY